MQMMLAIHTSTRDHELWVVSAEVKMSFTSAVLSPKRHSCGGGGHDWCPHLLTDAMTGSDLEGGGQPDLNLVCFIGWTPAATSTGESKQ